MARIVYNPCSAIIKKSTGKAPDVLCRVESTRLHSPGTKDGRRYCEYHYAYLEQAFKKIEEGEFVKGI